MGRRKITIRQITDPKLRHITFNKRKNGLIKKAAELSMLCNINMLLVFEDGAGNLVQFSKNKISSANAFFQECKYTNLIELTAKEYPHFFKVNHYKKTKHQHQEAQQQEAEDDEDDDDDDDSSLNNNMEMYGFSSNEGKPEQAKQQALDLKSKEGLQRKTNQQQQQQQQQNFNAFMSQQTKSEMVSNGENDRSNFTTNQNIADATKKQKGKQGLQLNMNAQDNGLKQQQKTPSNEMQAKMAPVNNDLNESLYNPNNNPFQNKLYQDEQSKSLADAQFMAQNMDLKRLGGVADQMNAPFQFYPNNRLRPFNNFGLPFGNEETFNSMLKNYSSFPFPIPGNVNVPFMGKSGGAGEMDDKLLDPAKVLNYLQQAGTAPLNRQNLFNFPPNDYSKMQGGDPMRQVNPTGAPEFHGNFMEDNHDEMLPTLFKGDPRFDTGMPSGSLNNRRYNFDGYMNGFEEDFGEKTKKFKHN